jgi:predicted chitinase
VSKLSKAISLGSVVLFAGCVGAAEDQPETQRFETESEFCKVVYETHSASREFTTTVTITNKGDAIEAWDLAWSMPSSFQKVTNVWDAATHQVDGIVTATAPAAAPGLAAGASVTFGFSGELDGPMSIPAEFALAGRSCGANEEAPSVGVLAATACSAARTWAAGVWFPTGSVVRYRDGKYYVAEHENPGYDPLISTWFWDPTTCGGTSGGSTGGGGTGGGGGGSCNAATWAAGRSFATGAVVRYPANGQYYIAEHENPGYDPLISTWFWDPTTCGGSGGGGTGGTGGGGGGGTGGGTGFASIVSEAQFNAMFPSRNAFYTYKGLSEAAATFAAFAGTGDTTTRKREVAAFLANAAHETGDLVYIEEIARGQYCQPSAACPCQGGKSYYGRGPIQLSWNYNYCAAGAALGLDLRADPDLVARSAKVAWQTGLWFWMTQSGAGYMPPHTAVTNGSGFGETIRSINGSLECGGRNPGQVNSRIERYRRYSQILGVAPGDKLGC